MNNLKKVVIIPPRNKKEKILAITMIIFIILVEIILFYFFNFFSWHIEPSNIQYNYPKELYKLKIINLNSKSRIFAVMINNHDLARLHHVGLQESFINYEIIVEGGLTRYMALFKDKDLKRIGSVRSSRHYFLDYALENDAIYTHFGWSPYAEKDIKKLKINNINGMYDQAFYRDYSFNIPSEHTAYTKISLLKEIAKKRNYPLESNNWKLLNYSIFPYPRKGDIAKEVNIKYSNYVTTKYVYDENLRVYKRFVNNKPHLDDISKKQYTTKNIIVYQVPANRIKNDPKGRMDISNLGKGEGYYISNGIATRIIWEKNDRKSKTKYKFFSGEELIVNDGNTWIQIQPKGNLLEIK